MKKIFKWWEILIIFSIFAILIVLGALKDLEIANFVYESNNTFAWACNVFGYFPSPIMASSGAMLLYLAKDSKKKFYSFLRICMIIGATAFSYYYIMDNLYEDFNSFFFCAFGALVVAMSMFITYLLARKTDKEVLMKVGMLMIFAVGFETGFVGIICKKLLSRPRYRFLLATSNENFRNFWQFDSSLKEKYLLTGILESEFESFPSGHASGSMCLALLYTLPYITNNKRKSFSRLYLILGIIFSFIVSYGRMVEGAHFLSDVSFGMLVTLSAIIICHYIFIEDIFKINKR